MMYAPDISFRVMLCVFVWQGTGAEVSRWNA